ncbi:MAG TPA: class I SAM-dependent methyltransferase [Candidatus Saccharimonadales bacterium]|nr:class I SAM-dependent methyltransferase [Candidatus Saccharimonadales bacterium]
MVFWLVLALFFLSLAFGLVVFFGPPYLPTFKKQIDVALDMVALQPGETLLELGSGDGRVMLAAARRGLKVVGIELNPLLVLVSFIVTWRYRKQVRIIWGNYWGKPWPRADGIFTFMLPKYMGKLDDRIEKWRPKAMRLVSFAFALPEREYVERRENVFLYEYK